jgi:hypothetical protein
MPRYLTFDEKTASALRTQVPEQQVFEHGASGAVDYALGCERNIVAVMPLPGARQAVVAVFRKPKVVTRSQSVAESRKPVASVSAVTALPDVAIRAGGFLGLRDEPVFEEEPIAPRKQSWWRKIWPEDE